MTLIFFLFRMGLTSTSKSVARFITSHYISFSIFSFCLSLSIVLIFEVICYCQKCWKAFYSNNRSLVSWLTNEIWNCHRSLRSIALSTSPPMNFWATARKTRFLLIWFLFYLKLILVMVFIMLLCVLICRSSCTPLGFPYWLF